MVVIPSMVCGKSSFVRGGQPDGAMNGTTNVHTTQARVCGIKRGYDRY